MMSNELRVWSGQQLLRGVPTWKRTKHTILTILSLGAMAISKRASSGPPIHNTLSNLVRMMGENSQVVDLPWGTMDGSKWPNGGPLMHNVLCSLARMMGENDQKVYLKWGKMDGSKWPSGRPPM